MNPDDLSVVDEATADVELKKSLDAILFFAVNSDSSSANGSKDGAADDSATIIIHVHVQSSHSVWVPFSVIGFAQEFYICS